MMQDNDNHQTDDTVMDAANDVQDETIAHDAEQDQSGEAQPQTAKAAKLPPREMTDDEVEDALRLLEALLFTASDVVMINDLVPFFPPQTPLGMLLERLETQYAERGINLVQRGNGWALRTAPDLGDRLQIRKNETKPMSRPVIETLAIIAYHQPVTKPEIEQIRGVSLGKNIFENLLEQNLIKPGKRREVPGRPLTWVTTQHFLDMFSLTSLKDLPNLQEMKDQGLLTVTPPNFNLQANLGLDGEDGAHDMDDEADDADEHDDTENQETLSSDAESAYADETDQTEEHAA